MKTLIKSSLLGLFLTVSIGGISHAAGGAADVGDHDFSFDGAFGTFDQAQLQRGFQVYSQVCAACHGLKYVSFRTLSDKSGPGFSEDVVKVIAAEYEFEDDEGEFKPGKPFDYFPVNDGAGAPDLSLMTKARPNGADYMYALLTGYKDAPSCAPDDFDGYYNAVFPAGGYPDSCLDEDGKHKYPGSWIAMAPPFEDQRVEYTDGAPVTLNQHAEDITAFLAWSAEPHMVERKQSGIRNIGFLGIFAVLLWFTNRKIWYKIKHPEDS